MQPLHSCLFNLSKGRFIYMTVKLLKTSLVSKFWGAIQINIFSMGKKTIILNLTKSHQKCAVIKYTEHPRWQRQRLLKRSASIIVLQTIIKYVRTMAAGIPAQRKMGYVAAPLSYLPGSLPRQKWSCPTDWQMEPPADRSGDVFHVQWASWARGRTGPGRRGGSHFEGRCDTSSRRGTDGQR